MVLSEWHREDCKSSGLVLFWAGWLAIWAVWELSISRCPFLSLGRALDALDVGGKKTRNRMCRQQGPQDVSVRAGIKH